MNTEVPPNDSPTTSVDTLEVISARNAFYRDSYRRVLIALNLAILAMLVLLVSIIYIISNPPQPKYFATYSDGRLVPMIPLNMPNITHAAILQWVTTAVTAVNTYDFFNYRDQLQKSAEYFTTDGWQAYLTELKNSRNLNAVIEKKLVVSAVATRPPVILREGPVDGVYTWVMQVPFIVTYQSASAYSQQSLIGTIVVKRISTLTNPNGIAINNYIAAEGYPTDSSQAITTAAQG